MATVPTSTAHHGLTPYHFHPLSHFTIMGPWVVGSSSHFTDENPEALSGYVTWWRYLAQNQVSWHQLMGPPSTRDVAFVTELLSFSKETMPADVVSPCKHVERPWISYRIFARAEVCASSRNGLGNDILTLWSTFLKNIFFLQGDIWAITWLTFAKCCWKLISLKGTWLQ